MLSVPLKNGPDGQLHLHASTVTLEGRALVIAGPSGSGKSALALRMIALGAGLIADDVTALARTLDRVTAHFPSTLPSLIEVRGLGLLNVPIVAGDPVHSILDLGVDETDRLPDPRTFTILGQDVPLLHKPATPYVAEAMVHYLLYGRSI